MNITLLFGDVEFLIDDGFVKQNVKVVFSSGSRFATIARNSLLEIHP